MKVLNDLLPIALFFIAYKFYGIFTATAVAIGASILQVGWQWYRYKKIDGMLLTSLGLIIILGGATLLLHDEKFIMIKPTVIYWLFSAAFILSPRFGKKKSLVKMMMAERIQLPEAGWKRLHYSWISFFTLMGALNLYVVRFYDMDTWVNFKLFGTLGITIGFIIFQTLLISKFITPERESKS